MMPESKKFDNNLSLSIYYASFQLKKIFLPGQRFCPRQIATVNFSLEHNANGSRGYRSSRGGNLKDL